MKNQNKIKKIPLKTYIDCLQEKSNILGSDIPENKNKSGIYGSAEII